MLGLGLMRTVLGVQWRRGLLSAKVGAHERQVDNASSRVLKGVGANGLGRALNLVSRIVLVPLFLRAWGVEIYGEWLVLSSVTAYLSLADMGGQLYVVNRLTQAYARGDIAEFRKVLHTGLALFLTLCGVLSLLFIAAVSWISPESFLGIWKTSHATVVVVLAILASQFALSLPEGLILGVYRSVGLFPRGAMLANLVQGLQLALVAGGLLAGRGMVVIASLQCVPLVLVGALALRDLTVRFPSFKLLSLSEASVSLGKTFVTPSLHFLLIQVAQALSLQGMVILVGAVLGPVPVVVFSTMRTIVNTMTQMHGTVVQAAWPEMTRLEAQRSLDKLVALFRAVLRSTLLASAVLVAVLHYYGGAIYGLWLGGRVPYNQIVMDLFLAYGVQMVCWRASRNLLMAINRHETLARVLLASSVLSILLAYLGARYLGVAGTVAGMTLGDLAVPFWAVPYLLYRNEPRFSLAFWVREVGPAVSAIAVATLIPWAGVVALGLLGLWWARCLGQGRGGLAPMQWLAGVVGGR